MPAEIVFVTGTGTSVGKTALTALLLAHLRRQGKRALAIKPFCSGDRRDAELLGEVQEWELTLDVVNPFFFTAPIAPAVAAWQSSVIVTEEEVVERIEVARAQCDILLVEGAGGLLSPLWGCGNLLNLISRYPSTVIVVGKNELGVLNAAELTLRVLDQAGCAGAGKAIALMGCERPDASAVANAAFLRLMRPGLAVTDLPFFREDLEKVEGIREAEKKAEKALALVASSRIVCGSSEGRPKGL